jgi:hypothetical protein
MLMRPSGPCSLNRITQSRNVWRSIPPIFAASSRETPSSGRKCQKRRSTSGDRAMAGWVSDARKLKALEDENRRLKKLLAESMLDAATLKEMLGKNF